MRYWFVGVVFVATAGTVMACSSDSEPTESFDPVVPVTVCEHLDELSVNNFFVQNNMWGKDSASTGEQCVGRAAEGFPINWSWNWPEESPSSVKGYPFIGFGQDPWRTTSTDPGLPRQAGSIATLNADYSISVQASGRYNLAFDIWVTAAPGITSPPESNITREIMIWVATEGGPPLAPLEAQVDIGGEEYGFHRAPGVTDAGYTRDYLAFIKTVPRLEGTIPIHEFIGYLLANDHLTGEEYVRNIFLGNEVWYGNGEVSLDHFTIDVQ